MARSDKTSPAHPCPLPHSRAALIIFTKAPIPGQVKTRLCPPLTPDEAATLHGSVVLDILERSETIQGVDRILACAPSQHHPFFQVMKGRQTISLWEQVEENLGRRMDQALQSAFTTGYSSAILVGTDLPTLSLPILQQAYQELVHCDVVLGPTLDGGYYLIGLNQPAPDLFIDIPWSTKNVLNLTQQKARALGLSVTLLPQQRDLDTVEDLKVFIQTTRAAGPPSLSVRTANILKTLGNRLASKC